MVTGYKSKYSNKWRAPLTLLRQQQPLQVSDAKAAALRAWHRRSVLTVYYRCMAMRLRSVKCTITSRAQVPAARPTTKLKVQCKVPHLHMYELATQPWCEVQQGQCKSTRSCIQIMCSMQIDLYLLKTVSNLKKGAENIDFTFFPCMGGDWDCDLQSWLMCNWTWSRSTLNWRLK